MTFSQYLSYLGFSEFTAMPVKNRGLLRAFSYGKLDVACLRKLLGRAKAFDADRGLHVFVLAKDKVIRVDTNKRIVLLGNGQRAVQVILASVVSTH